MKNRRAKRSSSDAPGSPGGPNRTSAVVVVAAAVVLAGVHVWMPRSPMTGDLLDAAIFLLITFGCALTGYGLLRLLPGLDVLERLVLGYAVGLLVLMLGTFGFGMAGALHGVPLLVLLLATFGAYGAVRILRADLAACEPAPGDGLRGWNGVLAGVVAGLGLLILLAAHSAVVDYDAMEYHAGVPAEWLAAGRIVELPHNVYSHFPMGAEMLQLAAMAATGGPSAGADLGKLLGGSCTLWAALALVCVGRRLWSLRAGLVAAALYLTVPWVFRVSVLGFVEDVQGMFTVTALLGVIVWLDATRVRGEAQPEAASADGASRDRAARLGLAGLAGAMIGGTLLVKATNLALVLPVGVGVLAVVGWRRHRCLAPAAVAAALAVAVGAAFYVRNLVLTGNPLFPVWSTWLGGPDYWSQELAERFAAVHSPGAFTPRALWAALAGGADQPMLDRAWFYWSGGVLALAPAALVRRDVRRPALAVLAVAAWFVVVWFVFTHRVPRLLVPAWALVALVAGAGLTAVRWRPAVWTLAVVVVLLAGSDVMLNHRTIRGRAVELALLDDARAPRATGGGYEFQFDPQTTARLWNYSPHTVRRINDLAAYRAESGRSTRVGLVGEARVLYFEPPIVYNTAFNRSWLAPLEPVAANPAAARAEVAAAARGLLAARGVTHVYVNWLEVDRLAGPGNYGWPAWIDRRLFDRFEAAGVLRAMSRLGPADAPHHVVYAVAPGDVDSE